MLYDSNIIMATRCGDLLLSSRYNSGLSRKAVSEVMGVSETTVRAWEDGQGSPTLFGMLEWFRITGKSYFRAMLDFFWPDTFKGLKGTDSDDRIKNALITYLTQVAGPIEIRKLHYLVLGNHGSEWIGLLDMACAHAHTCLRSRLKNAEIIQASYDICRGSSNVRVPNIDVYADCALLRNAIRAAEKAQSTGLNGYTLADIFGKDDKIVSGILLNARMDANVSRKDIAKALGKTERTIQNWENGFNPSFLDICMWFHAIGKSAWTYIQCSIYGHDVHYHDDFTDDCREELIRYFSVAESSEIRKLSYVIMGQHGSNWLAMLEALFEHVCTPLAQRVISALSILVSYSVDAQHTEIVEPGNILPDTDNLRRCIELGTAAAKAGKYSYTASPAL